MPTKKGAGLNHSENVHYLDHIGVICTIMDAPVLVIDDLNYDLAKKYYPDLEVIQLAYEDLTPDYLFEHYDVLYISDLWGVKAFRERYHDLEEKYHKQLRLVHCPHGYSDKAYYLHKCVDEDILLVYGQNMLDMFKNLGILDQLKSYAITGNYRYTYYQKHKAFYENLMQKEVLCKFKHERPIILYAPTWLDSFDATTFFDACATLIDTLPDDYNMIVKLHPRLQLDDAVAYYTIINTYEEKENVIFLCEHPPIYPLLEHTDIYIGDTSSIGYDFLRYNKPMFFLNKHNADPQTNSGLYLFRCGVSITPEKYTDTYRLIAEHLPHDQERFGKIRKEMYDYTFGPEMSFEEINNAITKTYNEAL